MVQILFDPHEYSRGVVVWGWREEIASWKCFQYVRPPNSRLYEIMRV